MAFDFSDHGPYELSRRLHEAAQKLRRWEQRGGAHPFGQELFPGKTTFDAVRDLPDFDPLKMPLLRWVHRLTEARIAVPFLSHERHLVHEEKVLVREPTELQLSRQDLRIRLLGARRGEHLAWARSWARQEQPLSDHRVQLWNVYSEVSERLGEPDPVAFWDPVARPSPSTVKEGDVEALPLSGPAMDSSRDQALGPEGAPSAEQTAGQQEPAPEKGVSVLARRLLQETKDAAEEVQGEGYVALLQTAAGYDASEGWPARLVPDTLRDLLRAPELFRSVPLDLGPLPARVVPMSFPRAIYRVGQALSWGLAPTDVPIVVARDLDQLMAHYSGSLLYLWSLSPHFLRKTLDLSGERLSQSTRALGAALLVHLRLEAARALWAEAALSSKNRLLDVFTETSSALLCGEELPPTATLARFSMERDQGARFAGLLWAGATWSRLIEEFDEDWFLNPRAQEWLREELARPAPLSVERTDCELGLRELHATCVSRL